MPFKLILEQFPVKRTENLLVSGMVGYFTTAVSFR